MRYLAIDHGLRRTGLAICDPQETLASPYRVLQGKDRLCERIARIVQAESVEAVVVGLPLNMDGTEGPQAKAVRHFIRQLTSHISVPILLHDERLSSFSAAEKLADADLTAAQKRRHLDAIAAAEILQAFLDHKKGG
jgi:putative holliday junction resolvase